MTLETLVWTYTSFIGFVFNDYLVKLFCGTVYSL